MSETKTEESVFKAAAVQMKRDQSAESATRGFKTWRYSDWPRTPQQACDFVNSDPAQGAGEAIFVPLPEYRIGVYYLI